MSQGDSQGRERGRSGRFRERKQRVLHTRVSDALAEDIRRMAEDLRVPASNLVRNVLEEAFSIVEAVSENMGDLIEDVVDEADRARERMRHRRRPRSPRGNDPRRPEAAAPPESGGFPDVIGWQFLILNRPERCAACEELLERGQQAYLGVTSAGAASTALCEDCMSALRR